MAKERNLMLPGNPRYQPKSLCPYFGYDNLMRPVVEVEIATLQVLGEIGIIPPDEIVLLTPEVIEQLLEITTTEVDRVEREVTKHDIRALVRCMQEILPVPLRRWVHIPLTSYDALDTARTLMFARCHTHVVHPKIAGFCVQLAEVVRTYASTLQIGRTHGQHALPITVGFWLATILSRVIYCLEEMDRNADLLVGKISGAVGAYNAQHGLGFPPNFEARVLAKLGLRPAKISTQILPPEPLALYLHACVLTTGAIAQLGRDCRQLMRTEIGEVCEQFEAGQVGSSTMAHKRNPISYENSEGMFKKNKKEYFGVLDTLISEHQRDLVDSSVCRDFPIIVVNLVQQVETYLRQNQSGKSFLQRMHIDEQACLRNFRLSSHLILAEPLYIALQMAGYPGDAHELVNRQLVPDAQELKMPLIEVLKNRMEIDPELKAVFERIPDKIQALLHHPDRYTGRAAQKALEIAEASQVYTSS